MIENLAIIKCLQLLGREFKKSPGLILSESDLKCHIFRHLHNFIRNHEQETSDAGFLGSPLHSEIKFFDESQQLSLIPDITILNPKDLSIFHSHNYKITRYGIQYQHTSGKQFSFTGNSIVMELKFCKNRKGVTAKQMTTFKRDIDKINRLQSIGRSSPSPNKIIGYFILFSKYRTSDHHIELLKAQGRDDLIIYYDTSELKFSKERMRKRF